MGTIDARLATLDASLEDWQDLISTALRFATNCARIYRRAGDSRRKEFNTAWFGTGTLSTRPTRHHSICSLLCPSSNTRMLWRIMWMNGSAWPETARPRSRVA
jgi:hypothetical protein